MKYCRKCGAKMTDDALFCSKCGCKVIEPKDLDVTEDAAENEQAEGNESANTPDLDLQPVVSQPVKSVSEVNSEAKSSYGRTRVQYSTPSNTPPLLDELSSMYKNLSRSSLILSIVDMIGTIDWILLGIAFVSWDRLLIPGILFIIYGVGMWVAAVMNFKEYLKARKVSNQLHTDPPQTLGEVIDTFRYEAENEKLFRSLSTVDTVNIFFRFYNVGKYMIKYRCINDYLSENKDSLDIILKAYSQKSVQSNNPDEELRKQKEAFSVRPKTDYQKKLKIRIRAIIVGIILIILIPVLIVLNKSMRDPEYANYIGEKYGHTNTATQQNSKIQSYTAEEFINKYNELASYFDGVVDTFDYSTGKKEKHKDSLWIYSFSDSRKEKSLSLMVDCSSTSEKVVSVSMSFYISEDDDPVYRYDVANAITVFIKNLPLEDASAACEQTVEKGEYTDSQIAGITLYYEKDSSYNTENWFILLSGEDSTTVQSSNQTDIKTEESSRVSEKETSTVQESEVSKVKEISEVSQKQETSKIENKKNIYPEGIYDRVVEILHNNIYSDMDLEYSFGHIIGSDDLFMFVKRGNTTASRFISAYQITDKSVYLIDGAFSGGANSLYVNDKDQVGIYYAKQGYSYYGMVTYEYGKLVHHTEYESDESSMSVPPPCPGEWIKWASVSDLTLLKEVILVETDSVSETNTTNEIVYSDKVFYYNGVIYYTPEFAGEGAVGYLDFSKAGEKYKALPLPDYTDAELQKYDQKVNIDSFLIVDDIVYYTDQEPGSAYTMPARLYKMKLDGSDVKPIVSNVDVGFCYKDGNIYFSSRYSLDRPDSGESGIIYAYNISTEQMTTVDENISFEKANMIFSGQSTYYGGVYYTEPHYSGYIKTDRGDHYNLVYYRLDNDTNTEQIVGYANVSQF